MIVGDDSFDRIQRREISILIEHPVKDHQVDLSRDTDDPIYDDFLRLVFGGLQDAASNPSICKGVGESLDIHRNSRCSCGLSLSAIKVALRFGSPGSSGGPWGNQRTTPSPLRGNRGRIVDYYGRLQETKCSIAVQLFEI